MNARGDLPPRLHRIEVEGGSAFEVDSGEDTLLRGALRAGLAFPYECSVGGCGSCRFELLDGEVRTLWADAPGLSARDRARGRRLACQSQPLGDCRIRVRVDAAAPSVGMVPRRMQGMLASRRDLTPDMAEFAFRVPPGAGFLPGQYAVLHLPGVVGVRAYSMSNLAGEEGTWRFIVRRVPGGRGSTTLFDRTGVGSCVELDGPYGHAHLRPGDRDVVCVAGGSGLGPMLSVARGVLAEGGARRVHFFLGLRTQHDLGARDEIATLVGPRLQATTVLSAPLPGLPWDGPAGFVHAALAALPGGVSDACDYYFAGPPPMVEALQDLLVIQARVPHGQIHFDRFV